MVKFAGRAGKAGRSVMYNPQVSLNQAKDPSDSDRAMEAGFSRTRHSFEGAQSSALDWVRMLPSTLSSRLASARA